MLTWHRGWQELKTHPKTADKADMNPRRATAALVTVVAVLAVACGGSGDAQETAATIDAPPSTTPLPAPTTAAALPTTTTAPPTTTTTADPYAAYGAALQQAGLLETVLTDKTNSLLPKKISLAEYAAQKRRVCDSTSSATTPRDKVNVLRDYGVRADPADTSVQTELAVTYLCPEHVPLIDTIRLQGTPAAEAYGITMTVNSARVLGGAAGLQPFVSVDLRVLNGTVTAIQGEPFSCTWTSPSGAVYSAGAAGDIDTYDNERTNLVQPGAKGGWGCTFDGLPRDIGLAGGTIALVAAPADFSDSYPLEVTVPAANIGYATNTSAI